MELCFIRKSCFFLAFLLLWMRAAVHSMPTPSRTGQTTANISKNESNTDTESHSNGHKIKVAKFDFENIATPFIVTVWVLLASLLKVGKSKNFDRECCNFMLSNGLDVET